MGLLELGIPLLAEGVGMSTSSIFGGVIFLSAVAFLTYFLMKKNII